MLSPEEIRVASEALGSDAVVWDGVSSTLSTASSATGSMRSSDAAFCWKGDELFAQYTEIVEAVSTYLSDGASAASDGAQALRDVRDLFIAREDETVSTINGAWEVQL
ncbi:hypothetical protein [Microbacterium sp. NPDC087589]|uniref:hypothetical protein n=1 Tax=Microbacterium sp. NPDC087589 TaxID=3364191 RepID=UPI00382A8F45